MLGHGANGGKYRCWPTLSPKEGEEDGALGGSAFVQCRVGEMSFGKNENQKTHVSKSARHGAPQNLN
jgi:hypothetical protein